MGPNRYYKKYIEKIINSNPTPLKITRNLKKSDGYGGYIPGSKTVNERVFLYEKKYRKEVVTESGVSFTGISVIKILGSSRADIKEKDTFSMNGAKYKVTFIKKYDDICVQAEVMRV